MKEQSLSSSSNILEKDYDDVVHNKGDLDDRVFINDEDSLLGSGSLLGGAVNVIGIKRKFDSIASPSKTISSLYPCTSLPLSHTLVPSPFSTCVTTDLTCIVADQSHLPCLICLSCLQLLLFNAKDKTPGNQGS